VVVSQIMPFAVLVLQFEAGSRASDCWRLSGLNGKSKQAEAKGYGDQVAHGVYPR
jgi:hypothetical protein